MVPLGSGVFVIVGVRVGVKVAVGVRVKVGVDVGVKVAVGVRVEVDVGVGVGVNVVVKVGCGVGVLDGWVVTEITVGDGRTVVFIAQPASRNTIEIIAACFIIVRLVWKRTREDNPRRVLPNRAGRENRKRDANRAEHRA